MPGVSNSPQEMDLDRQPGHPGQIECTGEALDEDNTRMRVASDGE